MVDLSKYVSIYPVVIDDAVEGQDGRLRRNGRRSFMLTPDTIGAFVDELAAAVHAKHGEPTCLLSLAPTAGDTNVEHVVLQGLGVRWVELPTGLVRASVNNRISPAEQQFLRDGLMGTLRPFYVGGNKQVEFNLDDGTTIRFVNDSAKGFEIHVVQPEGAPLRDLGLPDEAGEGVLRLEVPVRIPNPRASSVALHKLAYLTLCMVDPNVALDEALQPTRDFVLGDSAYRPYAETFIPAAAPGFEASFYVARSERSNELRQVQAVVRLHHVRYSVGLAGSDLVSRFDDAVPETLPGSTRNTTVAFGIGSLRRQQ